jgi:hypothetical protein
VRGRERKGGGGGTCDTQEQEPNRSPEESESNERLGSVSREEERESDERNQPETDRARSDNEWTELTDNEEVLDDEESKSFE